MKNIMVKMTGMKTMTEPTPATILSVTSDEIHDGAWINAKNVLVHPVKGFAAMPSSQSAKDFDKSKVSLNVSHMAAKNRGMPRKRLRAILSIFSVRSTLSVSRGSLQ
jgi:hypothetical protein